MGFRCKQGESCSSVGKASRSRAPSIYVHAVYKSVYTEDLSPWTVSSARAGDCFSCGQVTEGSDPTTVVSSRCPLVCDSKQAETAVVVVQGDALYDAGDFLGRGSALRDRGFHA